VGKEESGTGSVPLFVQYSYPQRGHSYCKWTLFEEAHHRVGRSVEDHDARPEEIVEEAHERGDEQRCPLRPGYGHALGCKLAEDDVLPRSGRHFRTSLIRFTGITAMMQ
jgi:hypothetical protein